MFKKQSSVVSTPWSNPSAFLYDTVIGLIDEHTKSHDTTTFDLFVATNATFEAQEEDDDSAASTLTDRLRQLKDELTRQIDTIEQPFEQLDELTPYAREACGAIKEAIENGTGKFVSVLISVVEELRKVDCWSCASLCGPAFIDLVMAFLKCNINAGEIPSSQCLALVFKGNAGSRKSNKKTNKKVQLSMAYLALQLELGKKELTYEKAKAEAKKSHFTVKKCVPKVRMLLVKLAAIEAGEKAT